MSKVEIGIDGRPARNFVTGSFLKGHIPHNSGKPWDEWLSKEMQQKILERGRKNLRPRMDIGGWNKRAVVCVNETTGEHKYCESAAKAGFVLNLESRNIIACCRGKRKRCGGLRWFYFDSNDWVQFIKRLRNDSIH